MGGKKKKKKKIIRARWCQALTLKMSCEEKKKGKKADLNAFSSR